MIALVTAILGVASIVLELWVQNSPTRATEEKNDEDANLRQECLSLDAGAISERIDNVLRDNPTGDPAGVSNGITETGATGAK